VASTRGSGFPGPRRLPRGRHALAPEEVLADQRARLIAAVPPVVAEHGYETMSVADLVKRAAVSRNAFYNNFADKQACFAAAHEAGHERLLATLSEACDGAAGGEERVERSLGSGLVMLAAEPNLARMLFVEAPSSAGEEVALRHHEWLRRYAELLRSAFAPAAPEPGPIGDVDEVIVGGIASQVAGEVLQGRAAELRDRTEHFVNYILAFYGAARPDPHARTLVALDPEHPEYAEKRRREASA
jgi:TetR/AcrR family transcriptional regulator